MSQSSQRKATKFHQGPEEGEPAEQTEADGAEPLEEESPVFKWTGKHYERYIAVVN
jgi:hypothetical protein